MKPNIRNISKADMQKFLSDKGEKTFRAKQINEWLWVKGASSFEQMSNLSLDLRSLLDENFQIATSSVHKVQQSTDGTYKVLFKLFDDQFTEGVIIPAENRYTACVSSQIGCKLKCQFCATGKIGFKRNLEAGEIFDQITQLMGITQEIYGHALTNIVFMGMGEPLYNYENVNKAIAHITDPNGINFSPKRITVSTIGIPAMVQRLADDEVKYNLAVSLHSAIQDKRDVLMPISKNSSLDKLQDSLKRFTANLKKKVTFEYVLLGGQNDQLEDARALVKFCSRLSNKVNLIEYNEVDGFPFKKSSQEDVRAFKAHLESKGLSVFVRKSRGEDIDAACGQLANKLYKAKN